MDCIHVTGIRCYGYTGLLPEEQVLGQWFEVDLTLWLDLSPAGESDAIADTINYAEAVQTVQQLVKTSKFALIERLAKAIADAILEMEEHSSNQSRLQQVKVHLTKVSPPIPDFGGHVSIELTRANPKLS
ncbi:MAG: dihydroneopterin aldolase [Hormoscilla sp. GM7CHS1pb]|nr:dihydroneopterin aldolase [Hormoscilla sp. GM7CHS1pb]